MTVELLLGGDIVTLARFAMLLQPGGLKGKLIELKRCDGCGNDVRLFVDGVNVDGFGQHKLLRSLLPAFERAIGNGSDCTAFRQALNELTWMHDFERVSLIVLPTAAEIREYGRGRDEVRELLNDLLRFLFEAGDNR